MRATILILPLLGALLLAGCATPAEKQAKEERRQQQEIAKREQIEQKRDHERLRREQEGLRRRFAKYSTTELKMKYARYGGLIEHKGTHDLELAPLATKLWGTSDRQNIDKLIELERELLRRWKAGDADAKLPQFDAVTTSAR